MEYNHVKGSSSIFHESLDTYVFEYYSSKYFTELFMTTDENIIAEFVFSLGE